MKVVSGQTMQEIDRKAVELGGVTGLELMERAGLNCAGIIASRYASLAGRKVAIFAGKGNNGGDGFVIARILHGMGWDVTLLLHGERGEVGGDALVNLERLPHGVKLLDAAAAGETGLRGLLAESTLVVDAMLGTGLKSEVAALYATSICLINAVALPVVAVDIPSGVDASSGRILGVAVRAELTVTFALAKLGHVIHPGADCCGELMVTDIGIPEELATAAPGVEFFDWASAARILRRRERGCHKGDNGHSLIIAGSIGKSGAAAMAANSAMRSGAGLVTLAAPESIHAILEMKSTEAMTVPLEDNGSGALSKGAYGRIIELLEGKDVAAIGPGLGGAVETRELVRMVVAGVRVPLVMDADALNAIAGRLDLVKSAPSPAIVMTPHPGEMSRLAGVSVGEIEADRLGVAASFAAGNGVYLILKGAGTVIAAPDGRLALNSSGNPGMASGGMGDVLTGTVTALLAQGYEPFAACCLAVFCHGAAGDAVALEKGEIGIVATDLQEMLPYVFKMIFERRQADA